MDYHEAITDPENEQHEEKREWISEQYDPEALDPDAVNEELRRLR